MFARSLGVVPVLYRKDGVGFEDFSTYWSDVHGTFVALVEGPTRYRQIHFQAYDPRTWRSDAIAKDLPEGRELGGIAEFIYPNADALRAWQASVGAFADADDPNVFGRSASYTASPGTITTGPDAPALGGIHLAVMLKAAGSRDALASFLKSDFIPGCAAASGVRFAQAIFLDRYQTSAAPLAEGEIDRSLKPHEQHDAVLDLAFADEAAMEAFFTHTLPTLGFEQHVGLVNAYRAACLHVLIDNGRVTLAGWLGSKRAALVERVGAENISAALDRLNQDRLQRA